MLVEVSKLALENRFDYLVIGPFFKLIEILSSLKRPDHRVDWNFGTHASRRDLYIYRPDGTVSFRYRTFGYITVLPRSISSFLLKAA